MSIAIATSLGRKITPILSVPPNFGDEDGFGLEAWMASRIPINKESTAIVINRRAFLFQSEA